MYVYTHVFCFFYLKLVFNIVTVYMCFVLFGQYLRVLKFFLAFSRQQSFDKRLKHVFNLECVLRRLAMYEFKHCK